MLLEIFDGLTTDEERYIMMQQHNEARKMLSERWIAAVGQEVVQAAVSAVEAAYKDDIAPLKLEYSREGQVKSSPLLEAARQKVAERKKLNKK